MNKCPSPPQNTALPLDASTLDGLPDPVFLVGQSMIIVDYNRAARLHLGETVLGAKLDKSLDSADVIQAISDSLAGTPDTRSDIFLPYPIARHFEFSVWRLPNLKSVGPAWAMVVLHDVTASKKQTRCALTSSPTSVTNCVRPYHRCWALSKRRATPLSAAAR